MGAFVIMKRKKRRIKLGRRIGKFLDIPEEAFGDTLKICMIENGFASIENYKGVFECDKQLIKLRSSSGMVRIDGVDLMLGEIRSERAVVFGNIKSVSFEEKI